MLKKYFLVLSGNFLNAILGFLFLVAAAKTLSPTDFGIYSTFIAILIALGRINDFGTNSKYVSQTDITLNNLFTIKTLLFIIGLFISLLMLIYFKLNTTKIIFIYTLGFAGYFFNYLTFPYYQKQKDYNILILLNALPALIKGLFGTLSLLGVISLNLYNFLEIFSYSLLTSLFFIKKDMISLYFKDLFMVFKKTTLAGTTIMLDEVMPLVSNMLIETFSNIGIFSFFNKISTIFGVIAFSIFSVLLPESTDTKSFSKKTSGLLTLFVLALAILGSITGNLFINIFFKVEFGNQLALLYVLMFSAAFMAVYVFNESYFFVLNKTNLLGVLSILRLCLFIFFSLFLRVYFGLYGIAWGMFLSSLTTCLIQFAILSNFKLNYT